MWHYHFSIQTPNICTCCTQEEKHLLILLNNFWYFFKTSEFNSDVFTRRVSFPLKCRKTIFWSRKSKLKIWAKKSKFSSGRCLSELVQLVPLPYSWRRSTSYSDRLHKFFVIIPRCHHSYKDIYVNSFFPRTARLWNSLPIECFTLTYDVNGL